VSNCSSISTTRTADTNRYKGSGAIQPVGGSSTPSDKSTPLGCFSKDDGPGAHQLGQRKAAPDQTSG